MIGKQWGLGRRLYRMLLWSEESDEYMGYEEQGMSFEEWNLHKNHSAIKINTDATPDQKENDYVTKEIPITH
jgi:hypothetical protein